MAADRAAAPIRPFPTGGPLPAGLILRHLQVPDDYPAMNVIANVIRAAAGENFYTTDQQFQRFYDHLSDSDPALDVAIAEVDGRLVGYGRAASHLELDGTRIYQVIPFVDPTVAGHEVFGAMIEAVEARVRAIAAEHPPGDKLLETFGADLAPDRHALLAERGYEPVRYFYAMRRPTVDDLPDSALPAGLEIREVEPDHLRAIWDADQEAFRDHWGYTPGNEKDYELFLHDPVMSDTSLWRVAWDGDEVVGQVRSFISVEENETFGRLRGYTEHISVRRAWRRRGVARALIAASFPLLRARGMTEAALSVDTENTSGALRVYESCGFRSVSRSATYRKPLD